MKAYFLFIQLRVRDMEFIIRLNNFVESENVRIDEIFCVQERKFEYDFGDDSSQASTSQNPVIKHNKQQEQEQVFEMDDGIQVPIEEPREY